MGSNEVIKKAKRNPLPWLAGAMVIALLGIVFGVNSLQPKKPKGVATPLEEPPSITIAAADQLAIVQHTRALLEGKDAAKLPESVAKICGRHVFVELFQQDRHNFLYGVSDPKRDTTLCLPESIADAVQRLKRTKSWKRTWQKKLPEVRVGVEVISSKINRARLAFVTKRDKMNSIERARVGWRLHSKDFDLGKTGLYLRNKDGDKVRRHWVPPIEAVMRPHGREDNQAQLRRYTRDQLSKVGIKDTSDKDKKPKLDIYSFSTLTMLEESPGSKEPPLNPVRGNLPLDHRLDADDLYDTATRLTDYLVRVLDDKGRFDYEYYPERDQSSKSYNIVRHAGTTYSILFTHQYTGDEQYLEAGLRAKDYMVQNLKYKEYKKLDYHGKEGSVPPPFPEADGSVKLLALEMSGKASLGATSLALLAFAKIPEGSVVPEDAERIRHMVNFTWFLQCESGGFYGTYREALTGKCPDEQPLYYPGETLLALNTLYQVKPHPAYLSIAEKSIGFELKRFYDGTWPDHWVMQALNLMDENMPEKSAANNWPDAAHQMAKKYVARQYMVGTDYAVEPPYPEYAGGYVASKGPPRNTPTGSRSEAVAGVYRLLKRKGMKEEAQVLGDSLLAAAHFTTYEMYRPNTVYYLPNPKKALWGLRGSMADLSVRIDFNQHALVGVWGAWEVARDRGGIGWPIPEGAEAAQLRERASAGTLITKPPKPGAKVAETGTEAPAPAAPSLGSAQVAPPPKTTIPVAAPAPAAPASTSAQANP